MSSKEWKEYNIGDAGEVTTGFAFKSKDYLESGKYKVVRGDNVKTGFMYWDEKTRCWNDLTGKLEKYLLKENDIVIGMDGSRVGKNRSIINKKDLPALLAQRVACIRANNEFSQSYLRYVIMSKRFEDYVESIKTGTSIPHISMKQISEFKFKAPSLEKQEEIANILTSLDDKIDLNNETNKTLEEMVQALFKRWFVDFEFTTEEGVPYKSSGGEMVECEIGMIPKGWEAKTLDDIGDIISGGTPSTKNEDYYGGDISWITPKDLSGYDRKFISKGERSITELGLQKSSAKLLPKGSVLFSSRAPIGYVAIAENEVSTNQGFKSIICNDEIMNNNYIYYFLKYNKENIENVSSGSTFKEISGTHMKSIKIIVPNKVTLDKFNDLVNSFDNLLKKNYKDIDALEEIRDNLLPKLMSGKINV